jgi:hypothetical protein
MAIDKNQITLETVSIRLDSKKITNAILDQIPRKDFCGLLIDKNDEFTEADGIEMVCRFSLVSLLSSERRVYKIGGYDTEQTHRAMKKYDHQSEAFFFTVDGQLYCDSFSSKTGSRLYGEYHAKLEKKLDSAKEHLEHVILILDMHKQGVSPLEITKSLNYNYLNYGGAAPPRGLPSTLDDDWECGIYDWEDDLETKQSKDLNNTIQKYGSWSSYIKAMQSEFQSHQKIKDKFKNDLVEYEKAASNIIANILSKPFALLGC